MKALSLIIFGIAVLGQWLVPAAGIWQQEQVLAKGTLVRIKCAAPDPYDPLRGRYLAVRPEQDQVAVRDGMELKPGMPVYGTLTAGADGSTTVTGLSDTPPAAGDYIKFKSHWQYDGKATIEWPFDRFYINEKLAPEADKWFAENIRSAKGIVAEVRVLNGRAVLADLTLDGKSFREILKERVQ